MAEGGPIHGGAGVDLEETARRSSTGTLTDASDASSVDAEAAAAAGEDAPGIAGFKSEFHAEMAEPTVKIPAWDGKENVLQLVTNFYKFAIYDHGEFNRADKDNIGRFMVDLQQKNQKANVDYEHQFKLFRGDAPASDESLGKVIQLVYDYIGSVETKPHELAGRISHLMGEPLPEHWQETLNWVSKMPSVWHELCRWTTQVEAYKQDPEKNDFEAYGNLSHDFLNRIMGALDRPAVRSSPAYATQGAAMSHLMEFSRVLPEAATYWGGTQFDEDDSLLALRQLGSTLESGGRNREQWALQNMLADPGDRSLSHLTPKLREKMTKNLAELDADMAALDSRGGKNPEGIGLVEKADAAPYFPIAQEERLDGQGAGARWVMLSFPEASKPAPFHMRRFLAAMNHGDIHQVAYDCDFRTLGDVTQAQARVLVRMLAEMNKKVGDPKTKASEIATHPEKFGGNVAGDERVTFSESQQTEIEKILLKVFESRERQLSNLHRATFGGGME